MYNAVATGPWQSGLLRRTYNPVKRTLRRSESFRPRHVCYHAREMKVEKKKFDTLLGKLLKTKPEPRKKIKTQGKHGSKAPILSLKSTS